MKKHQHQRSSTVQIHHLDLLGQLKYEHKYGMPIVAAYNEELPTRLIRWDEALRTSSYSCTPHFYIKDELFRAIVHTPTRYLDTVKRFVSIIGPDFSQYINMPTPVRIYGSFWNKALSAFWQLNGINVIPNVSWSTPDSYEYSFAGIPKKSIIAINCTGILSNSSSKYLWRKGYDEAIRRLEPSFIVRYGDRMEGEREDISIFFKNEQIETARRKSADKHNSIKRNAVTNQLKCF